MTVNRFSFAHKYVLLILAFISVVVLGFLTACTTPVKPAVPAEPEVRNVDSIMVDVVEVERVSDLGKIDHIVSITSDSFIVMFGGSGSCPPMVENVSYDGESNTVSIAMYEYPPDMMCTRDYRQYFYEVSLTDDVISEETVFQVCLRDECFVL